MSTPEPDQTRARRVRVIRMKMQTHIEYWLPEPGMPDMQPPKPNTTQERKRYDAIRRTV